MVKVFDSPVQLTSTPFVLVEGVTVTVATTGALVGLVALKLAILPVPLEARPMEAVLFVQL